MSNTPAKVILKQADDEIPVASGTQRIKPDLVTLDLSMPVMNGLEAAVELRKLFPKTPIILFTMWLTSGVILHSRPQFVAEQHVRIRLTA